MLKRLNCDVSAQRLNDVLREVDLDHDGKISYEEFVHILQHT